MPEKRGVLTWTGPARLDTPVQDASREGVEVPPRSAEDSPQAGSTASKEAARAETGLVLLLPQLRPLVVQGVTWQRTDGFGYDSVRVPMSRAQSTVEYGLIVATIAVLILIAGASVGGALRAWFDALFRILLLLLNADVGRKGHVQSRDRDR